MPMRKPASDSLPPCAAFWFEVRSWSLLAHKSNNVSVPKANSVTRGRAVRDPGQEVDVIRVGRVDETRLASTHSSAPRMRTHQQSAAARTQNDPLPDPLVEGGAVLGGRAAADCWCVRIDRKSTRLNSSHQIISYAVFCLKKKKH